MKNIMIRDVEDAVALKLMDAARKNKCSREEYLRRLLKKWVSKESIDELDSRYEASLTKIANALQENTELLGQIYAKMFPEGK